MNWRIPLFKIYWDEEDVKAIAAVIRSGMYWAEGKSILEFEERIAEYIGSKYCVSFSSGTTALQAVLLAYDIGKNDQVIVPSFTFIATANAALFVGAKPVFADIEEETFGLDPQDVRCRITRRTKAIITVHYGGCPCRIKELRDIADRYKLLLIEDAAESFGARVRDKKVGTFGEAAMFSFCQNKIITTGEGGTIVTDSKRIYERLKLIRSHGRLEGRSYFSSTDASEYVCLGYNFRMPTLIAALGKSQIKKIDKIIRMRRENALYLTRILNEKVGKIITPQPPCHYSHVYQLYTIRIKNYRDKLKEYLASKGIMTKIYFSPVHLTKFYKNIYKKRYELPVTERVSKKVLSLPIHPLIKKKEMDYVVGEIRKFLKEQK